MKRRAALVLDCFLCADQADRAKKPSAGVGLTPKGRNSLTPFAVPPPVVQFPRPRSLRRYPGYESNGKHPSFLLSSTHDDRDRRTRAEGTKAKRRGRV